MRSLAAGVVLLVVTLMTVACGNSEHGGGAGAADDRAATAADRYSSAASPDDAVRVALDNMMKLNSWRVSGSSTGSISTTAEVQVSVSPRVIYSSSDFSLMGGTTETLLRGDEVLLHTPKENEEFAADHPGLTADTWVRVPHQNFSLIDFMGDPYLQFGVLRDTIRRVTKLGMETIDGQSVTRYHAQMDPEQRLNALQRMNPSPLGPLGDTADFDDSMRAQAAQQFPSEIEYLIAETGYLLQDEQSVGSGDSISKQTQRYSGLDLPLSVPEPAHIMDKDW